MGRMKKLFIIILCLFSVSCLNEPSTTSTNSSENTEEEESTNSGEAENPDTSISDYTYRYTVSGGKIYHNGEEVNFFGVNWFGFETTNYVVHGLWARNYLDLIAVIKELEFNSVRLPFCPTTLNEATVSTIDYSQNEALEDLNSLEILDLMMRAFNENEIYVLLDHHRPDCESISELWYTSSYTESEWIDDLKFVATRYADLEYFMGIDLKNEPHGEASWGDGGDTDWKLAAERAATEILTVNDDILIFVEGIQENDLCSDGTYGHWWGGNLEPQSCYPLDIDSEKLVLSPHVYGPDVYDQDYFSDSSFPDNMPTIWNQHFGYLLADSFPVVPGEFGGKYEEGSADETWQNAYIDYMIENEMCSFFFWSFNPNSGDTEGILDDDWETLEQEKYDNLKRLMDDCTTES